MKSLRRQLPPMTALMAFEAAARLLSFTRAAEELGVTQAAVSRQIHALEEDFGLPLFNRLHRKVTLTAQGQALAAATSNAFGMIADAASDLRQGSNDDLTISATVAFSHFWLLPRISEFSRRHPDTTLRIVSQDAMPALDQGDVDVAIRFGEGNWPNVQAEKLFDDLVFPVCSPEFALSLDPDLPPPEDLIRKPLIAHEADDPMWIGWTEWLSHFGVTTTGRLKGMRCSFYTEAIYATLNGQGITLGWNRLVGDLIDQNRLVRLGDASLVPKGGYFVLVPAKRRQSQALQQFMTWLFESHSET